MEKEVSRDMGKLTKASLFVLVGILISKIVTYLYRILIARFFGPEIYGIFSLALIVLGFFTSFSSLGLAEGVTRFFSIYRGKKELNKIKYMFRISSIVLIFSSTLSGILLFAFSEFISLQIFESEKMIFFLKIFSFLIPFSVLGSLFLSIIRAFEKIKVYSFIWNILQNVVKLIFLGTLIFIGINESAIVFSYFLSIFSIFLVAYIFCKYKLKTIFEKPLLKEKKSLLKSLFSYSWPLLFSGMITSFYYWTDSFLIGYFMNPTEVGIYNSATPLIGLMAIVPVMFSQLFFPLITRVFSQGKNILVQELSKRVGKWIFLATIPIFVILFLFPEQIICLFFGSQYTSAKHVLRILCFSGFFSSFTFILIDLTSMAGKSKCILFNVFLTSILNIFLDFLLIPRFGITGAAIATTIGWASILIMLLIEVKHFAGFIPLKKTFFIALIPTAIPFAILLILIPHFSINSFGLILFSLFFFLVYVLLILLTGALDKQDIQTFKNLFKRRIK